MDKGRAQPSISITDTITNRQQTNRQITVQLSSHEKTIPAFKTQNNKIYHIATINAVTITIKKRNILNHQTFRPFSKPHIFLPTLFYCLVKCDTAMLNM